MSGEPSMKDRPNHLIGEKSPYLLQHAYNPVDWYPWGDAAFQKARAENKPVFLSIGYSTCHWCHVMERESFSNPDVAAFLNRYLVCIKVDREERPDIDRFYITAVSAMTGSAGWPLNVFLTHEGKPFFGGTYFPPDTRSGRPGLPQLVEQIGKAWEDPNTRGRLLSNAREFTESLAGYLSGGRATSELNGRWLENGFESFHTSYDGQFGGFGSAPKFPRPMALNFLFRYYRRFKDDDRLGGNAVKALEMALFTLRSMAKGGIYDQIGGGFHRYSTDALWRIPHFEKMLYDNAQLAVNYLEAFQITHDPSFSNVARETLSYVLRDMTGAEGGFYSAQDADSLPEEYAEDKMGTGYEHQKEGAFYLWKFGEFESVLDPRDSRILEYYFGVKAGGNILQDPFGEFSGKSILFVAHTVKETGEQFNLPEDRVRRLILEGKRKLLDARERRPRPHLDDKVVTSWNGLMISAFARAYQVLGENRFLEAAGRAGRFILENLYDPLKGQLYRRWRDGEKGTRALAEDYAFLTQGLIDLYEACFDPEWLEMALRLSDEQMRRFYDASDGGFFLTESVKEPYSPLRIKSDEDNVLPSVSSVSAMNLLRLSLLKDRPDLRDAAEQTLKAFGQQMSKAAESVPQMLVALSFALSAPIRIVIAGRPDATGTLAMLEEIHRRYIPDKTVTVIGEHPIRNHPLEELSFLDSIRQIDGKPTAYVCTNYSCRPPVNDVAALTELLDTQS